MEIKAKINKGKISFDDYEFAFQDDFKDVLRSFYIKQKESISALKNQDNLKEEIVKKMESANIYVKQPMTMQAPKKKIFNFKHKEKKIDNSMKHEQIMETLEKTLLSYDSLINGDGEIYIGIRPDNFYLAKDNKLAHPSKPIEVEVNMVELLGNEYIIHFHLFGIDMQAKIIDGNLISIGDHISLVYDLDKAHVFDIESGLTIK